MMNVVFGDHCDGGTSEAESNVTGSGAGVLLLSAVSKCWHASLDILSTGLVGWLS